MSHHVAPEDILKMFRTLTSTPVLIDVVIILGDRELRGTNHMSGFECMAFQCVFHTFALTVKI